MATRPILFNTKMVQAIKEGRKTQTRRLVRKKYDNTDLVMFTNKYGTRLVERQNDAPPPRKYIDEDGVQHTVTHMVAQRELDPPCKPGDILWVRETWRPAKGTVHTYIRGELEESDDWHDGFEYRAGGYHYPDGFNFIESADEDHLTEMRNGGNWHPSIHMPKEAARIFLRVKDVWVERLKDICEKYEYGPDHPVVKEGFRYTCDFIATWENTINPANRAVYGWDANPWVWVIEFERCAMPESWNEGKEAMDDA